MSKRYDLIGYCSYRDNETGKVSDNFVGVLNEQDQKIKELEQRLSNCIELPLLVFSEYVEHENWVKAEKDKEIAKLKQQLAEWKDGTVIVKWTDAENKVKELEQQLAEKEQAIEGLQEINQSLGQACNNDAKEIGRLREQLAEKDEEIKQLKAQSVVDEDWLCSQRARLTELEDEVSMNDYKWNMLCNYLGDCIVKYDSEDCNGIYSEILSKVNEIQKYNQNLEKSKLDFTICELEKVKTLMRQDFTIAEDYFKVVAIIDQQIELLKGDK